MGTICSDPQIKPTYEASERKFSVDEDDPDLNSFTALNRPKREFDKFQKMDRTYHQGGHRSYTKPRCRQTKRINQTDEEVIVITNLGRTHPNDISPRERMIQRCTNSLTYQENSRDIIGSLCDHEAKEKIKKILEPILLQKVRQMIDHSVEELIEKVTCPDQLQNSLLNVNDTIMPAGNPIAEKASSGRHSGDNSKRSSGEQRRSESADSNSSYFQPQWHQTKKYTPNEGRKKEVFLGATNDYNDSRLSGIVNPSIKLSQVSSITSIDPENIITSKITISGEQQEILGGHTRNPFSDAEYSEFEQKEFSPHLNITIESANTNSKNSSRKKETV